MRINTILFMLFLTGCGDGESAVELNLEKAYSNTDGSYFSGSIVNNNRFFDVSSASCTIVAYRNNKILATARISSERIPAQSRAYSDRILLAPSVYHHDDFELFAYQCEYKKRGDTVTMQVNSCRGYVC